MIKVLWGCTSDALLMARAVPSGGQQLSVRCLERVWVIGIAGIGSFSAAGAQQFSILSIVLSVTCWVALLNVAIEFDEGAIGAGPTHRLLAE